MCTQEAIDFTKVQKLSGNFRACDHIPVDALHFKIIPQIELKNRQQNNPIKMEWKQWPN